MGKSNNNLDYQSISGIRELRYQRRMLSSRLEHQEIMISYQIRSIKETYSPMNLAYRGFESLAAKNYTARVAFKVFNGVRSFFSHLKR